MIIEKLKNVGYRVERKKDYNYWLTLIPPEGQGEEITVDYDIKPYCANSKGCKSLIEAEKMAKTGQVIKFNAEELYEDFYNLPSDEIGRMLNNYLDARTFRAIRDEYVKYGWLSHQVLDDDYDEYIENFIESHPDMKIIGYEDHGEIITFHVLKRDFDFIAIKEEYIPEYGMFYVIYTLSRKPTVEDLYNIDTLRSIEARFSSGQIMEIDEYGIFWRDRDEDIFEAALKSMINMRG